jgi:hypothetical protein
VKALNVAGVVLVAFGCHAPDPSGAPLTERELPGFSISLPAGDEESALAYRDGHVAIHDVAHSGGGVSVHWEPGTWSDHDEALMSSIAVKRIGGNATPSSERTTGPQGEPIITVHAKSDERGITMSLRTCGARRVVFTTAGQRMEALHRRVLASFDCHPDPAKDAAIGALPWVFDPPEGWKTHKAPAGRAEFRGDGSSVLVRGIDELKSREELEKKIPALLSVAGFTVQRVDWKDDRLRFSATIKGREQSGFVMSVSCVRGAVLLLVTSSDAAAADRAHDVLLAHGHCVSDSMIDVR